MLRAAAVSAKGARPAPPAPPARGDAGSGDAPSTPTTSGDATALALAGGRGRWMRATSVSWMCWCRYSKAGVPPVPIGQPVPAPVPPASVAACRAWSMIYFCTS
jgi:hypothetical protein